MQNKLVVFEGIDGVGKTTLVKATREILGELGLPAIIYESLEKKEPGFSLIKPFVRDSCPVESSLLFYLASAVYKSKIIEGLLKNHSVICDRYVFSTLAKHKALGFEIKGILGSIPIIQPDILFLVKADESIRQQRILLKDKITEADRVKKEPGSIPELMERFLEEFSPQILENNGTLDETKAMIRRHIQTRLKLTPPPSLSLVKGP